MRRGGFEGGNPPGSDELGGGTSQDDHIKGTNDPENGDVIDGLAGDDVILGRRGDDQLVGGDGEDDLSGGSGDDLLVGAIWTDDGNGVVDDADTFTQDEFSDDFDAEATFEDNGTDTIWLYDDDTSDAAGVYDVIDLSEAVEFVDTDLSGDISEAEMETQLNAAFSYDDSTGNLSDGDGNSWFVVYQDAGATAADTVYVEVDGNQFVWDGGVWDLLT